MPCGCAPRVGQAAIHGALFDLGKKHDTAQCSWPHTGKSFLNLVISKPNLDCNYTFTIDLITNGISSDAKSIGKV